MNLSKFELYYEELKSSRTLKDIKRERIEALKNKPEILAPTIEVIAKGIYYAYHGTFVILGFVGTYIEFLLRKWAYGK